MNGGSGSKVCILLASAHQARMEVERIRREMRACQCEREADEQSRQIKPCWKASFIPEVRGDWGRIECAAYWDHAGGNAEDGENHHLLWCGPCQTRETIRKGLEPARRRLAGLKSAIWQAAKKCAGGR